MLHNFVIKTLSLFAFINLKYITCHLKDLGEPHAYFTKIIKDIEKRIMGGEIANLKEFPSNVQFFNLGGLCGGTVLTIKTVMTAAHCFDHNSNIADMIIFSNPRFVYDHQALRHEVWDYILHPKYNMGNYLANDIGIIIIHDNFKFGINNQKAMLANTKIWMNEKEKLVASGWGEVEYGVINNKSKLKKAELHYVSKKRCMELNRMKIGPEMFCLYGDGVNDTCRGDSGGGVMWKGMIVGITSHGRGCGNAPGVYVNVYYMRNWIKQTVRTLNEKFCMFHK